MWWYMFRCCGYLEWRVIEYMGHASRYADYGPLPLCHDAEELA